jgi:ribonuclease J
LPKLKYPPIYGTKLTLGLVQKRLEEFGLERHAQLRTITKDDTLQLGHFNVSFFHVNHSIPDAVGVVVKSPAGNITHTGDFKFDFTPTGDQLPPDFARIASLASQDMAALFIDSTNALKSGYTVSEKKIGESLETVIKSHEGRIVISAFSSQIGRMQQIINFAKKYERTIFLSGRSLIDNVFIAQKLGYLKVPQGLIHDIRKVQKIPENKVLIITTGSQGEAASALTRMAQEDHPNVHIKKGDVVVLSSSPIPGNERSIFSVMNNLCKLGAHIVNNQIMDVHASGHAQQEDLKLMMNLVKAKNVVPIHGEYYMRYGNKEVAMQIGYDDKNCIIVENGGVIEIENGNARVTGEAVEAKYILIDGLGIGDIGAQVIMDRHTLSENGVLILIISIDEKTRKIKKDVDVISRGFIYMKESEELVKSISEIARDSYNNIISKRAEPKRGDIKKYIKESVDKFVHQKIERHPLVLPVIIEN